MTIDPAYNCYYIYSAVSKESERITYGACPVVWHPEVVLQGGSWKPGFTWADGNYHLFECCEISDENAMFIEECIYTALNEAEETFGEIFVEDQSLRVRWCLIEEPQIQVIMDLPG
jgi:hypothetical protein